LKFSGIVKRHLGRGRKLGYPTANINIDSKISDGLFLGITEVKGKKYPSLVFIGAPETFGDKDRRAESYLLNFSGDLYDQQVTIETIKKLRDNRKFDSQEALIIQMRQDERVAKEFFRNYNLSN
jgi:riboflavin kinase/FMN adenylyltransferase